MITIKVQELMESYEAVMQLTRMTFPMSTSYKIMGIAKKVHEEYKLCADTKKKILEDRGCELVEGKYEIPDELKDEIDQEWKEFLESDVKLEIEKLTIKDFKDKEVSPALLISLDWLIVSE